MKINNPLNEILNSTAKIRVLRFLIVAKAQWNGRQIAKEIAIAPTTAHRALRSLNKEGVVLMQNVGKTHIYRSNDDNFIVSAILAPMFANEAQITPIITGTTRNPGSAGQKRNP